MEELNLAAASLSPCEKSETYAGSALRVRLALFQERGADSRAYHSGLTIGVYPNHVASGLHSSQQKEARWSSGLKCGFIYPSHYLLRHCTAESVCGCIHLNSLNPRGDHYLQ